MAIVQGHWSLMRPATRVRRDPTLELAPTIFFWDTTRGTTISRGDVVAAVTRIAISAGRDERIVAPIVERLEGCGGFHWRSSLELAHCLRAAWIWSYLPKAQEY